MTSNEEAAKFADHVVAQMKAIDERGGGFFAQSGSSLPDSKVVVGGYDSVLLAEAERSANRAEEASCSSDAPAEAGAAAAAILCASAACEARVSEYLAISEFVEDGLPPALEEIRGIWDAREQWNRLLKERAPSFDPGASREYLAIGCLFRLRDHIAHRHARIADVGTFPLKLDDCARQGVIPVRRVEHADWTSVVFVHEVARWAANAGREWIPLAKSLLPNPRMCI